MAEVSGITVQNQGGDGSKNSSADGLIYCLPCSKDDINNPADGFCKNCEEHLCTLCIRYHKKFGITQNHSILDKAHMTSIINNSRDEMRYSELCPYHLTDVIKYFCPSLNTVHCGECIAFDHRGCKIAYIHDIAKDYVESETFREIRNHDVDKEFTNCVAEIDKYLNEAGEVAQNELEKIRHVKDKLNAHINKEENEFNIKLNQIKESQNKFLNDRMALVHAKKSEIGTETLNLLNNDDDIAKLFVKGKQSEGLLAICRTVLVDIKKGSAVGSYCFQPNQITDKFIQSSGVLGAIVEKEDMENKTKAEVKMTRAPVLKSFDVRGKAIKLLEHISLPHRQYQSHTTTCIALLSNERLLTCDHDNNTLVMLDIKSNLQLSTLALSNSPWLLVSCPATKWSAQYLFLNLRICSSFA